MKLSTHSSMETRKLRRNTSTIISDVIGKLGENNEREDLRRSFSSRNERVFMSVQNISTIEEILGILKRILFCFQKGKRYSPYSTRGKQVQLESRNFETRQQVKQQELFALWYMNLMDCILLEVLHMTMAQRMFFIQNSFMSMVSLLTSLMPILRGRSEELRTSMDSYDNIFPDTLISRVFRTKISTSYKRSSIIVRENVSDGSLRMNTMRRLPDKNVSYRSSFLRFLQSGRFYI